MNGGDFQWVLLGFAQNEEYVHKWFNPLHPYGRSPIRTNFDPDDQNIAAVNIAKTNRDMKVRRTMI